MANAQGPPPPQQRRFRARTNVHRMTAEERAAAIQAETLRQANQLQLQPSQTQQAVGKRTSPLQREPRVRNQDTGSVFSSAGAVPSSRPKNSRAVSGTEELIQRAEGGEVEVVEEEASGRAKAGRGVGEKAAGNAKKASGRSTKSTAKNDDVIYRAEDELPESEGEAVDIDDIDRISISSEENDEEEDEVVFSRRRRIRKTPKPNLGLRPVRAARDTLARDDARNEADAKVRSKGKERVHSKADPDHGDKIDLDDDEDDGGGMEITAKQATPVAENKSVLPSQSPLKRRRKSSTKDMKPQFETIEERAERERYTSELRKMRNELSNSYPDPPPKEDDSHKADLNTPQEGRLYLFQFPPLTPMLLNPSHQPSIKTEPSTDSHAPASPSEPKVKKEKEKEDATAAPEPKSTQLASSNTHTGTVTTSPEPTKLLTAFTPPTLPTGLAGKLNVHKSGKVTLQWGSGSSSESSSRSSSVEQKQTNLEVRWGAEVDFLQDVVLVEGGGAGTGKGEQSEEVGSGSGSGSGSVGQSKAWALRQVTNKFVVVPDWGRIYE